MAYLVYVYSQTGPQPQVVHDEAQVDYVRAQGHLAVLSQRRLTDAEADLTLDELTQRYPYVRSE